MDRGEILLYENGMGWRDGNGKNEEGRGTVCVELS